jgi:peptidoglycan/xylan/chitin deacetylase (PgdA/CDA1 family)
MVPRLLRNTDDGVIFMLHRFPDPEIGNPSAHDPQSIRAILAYLRSHNFRLISLSEMFDEASRGIPLRGAVAFTIDDGYRDHASIAAPLFAEFECPVTTFLTSGFLDGTVWFWWDQIEHVFLHTSLTTLDVVVADSPMRFAWSSHAERSAQQERFITACKQVRDDEKRAAIAHLAEAANVPLPARPPDAYAPMTWDDARRCERSGMSFGPHTVSHPILARATDTQSRFEIEESWRRVSAELKEPVPVFCYPNGQLEDFSDRETMTLANQGLLGAVVGYSGYASGADIRDKDRRFRVRRLAMPDNLTDAIQCVTGLERVKERLRSRRR